MPCSCLCCSFQARPERFTSSSRPRSSSRSAISTFNALTFSPMLSASAAFSANTKEPNRRTYTIAAQRAIGSWLHLRPAQFVGDGAADGTDPCGDRWPCIIGFRFQAKPAGLPLASAFCRGWRRCGFSDCRGDLQQSNPGDASSPVWACALGYFVPVIFSTFNTLLQPALRSVLCLVASIGCGVAPPRPIMMAPWAAGILLTGFAFSAYARRLCPHRKIRAIGIGFVHGA